MPNYEYTCADCGHSLEAHQPMNEQPLAVCPSCGQPALRRRSATAAGRFFRGCGFAAESPSPMPDDRRDATGT